MTIIAIQTRAAAMLFVLIASHLIVLAVANPFHKYPYVFLLDVGNEELQKTNSEQIRVSIPGGSLALRYPAVGDGDIIAHVRVSGIDFGTDLKANIIDGGPGYKYVVLVFMGNTGVPYDAVITVQTISNDNSIYNGNDINNQGGEVDNNEIENSRITDDDPNDSSEELDIDDQPAQNVKPELTQASSSYYNYAQKEEINSNDYNNDENDDNSEYQNIHDKQQENVKNEESDYDENDEEDEGDDHSSSNVNNDSVDTKYDLNLGTEQEENNKIESADNDNLYYDRYKLLRPYLYDGVRVYPQQAVQYIPEGNSRAGFFADSEDNEQNLNDEELHNDGNNYKDNNNNNFDSDDNSAVAS